MFLIRLAIISFLFFPSATELQAQQTNEADICVYGATSAGIIAAYTAKKLGHSVILISPDEHIGGLTTGGLGYTDIGNKYAVSGLGNDFYRKVGKEYGKFESWIFEPHVAKKVFQQYLHNAGVKPETQWELVNVRKENGWITSIQLKQTSGNGKRRFIKAKRFIDCSYEGDLMAKAGVSYRVGREANSEYGETYNGVQLRDEHQFPDNIDPYKIPGQPSSGLLWGISDEKLQPQGTGDKKVQAYNFRICLSNDPANRIPITRPNEYDSTKYELLVRLLEKLSPKNLSGILKPDLMPNHKTDINNNGPFSTDMIGMNYDYPDADWSTRRRIIRQHELYNKGLLYFIGHDSRVPEHLRTEMLQWGYPKDEYVESGHWSPQPYIREARRMVGAYLMTQSNCIGKEKVDDGIGMAAYTMDSHNCERLVVNGMVKNEGDVQIGGFGPYPIAYRSIIPKAAECKNLLVPVCLSATHIAYGSIRMEPVFMVLAQSAATAAAQSIESNVGVQDVDVKDLQKILRTNPLADGSTAEIIVDNADSAQVQVAGKWDIVKHIGFGPSVLISNDSATETATVQFKPTIIQAGYYQIYSYFLPQYKDAAEESVISVFNGERSTSVTVKQSDIKVQGQTSGEWVSMGRFHLKAGHTNHVTVHGGKGRGRVMADAILLVPDK